MGEGRRREGVRGGGAEGRRGGGAGRRAKERTGGGEEEGRRAEGRSLCLAYAIAYAEVDSFTAPPLPPPTPLIFSYCALRMRRWTGLTPRRVPYWVPCVCADGRRCRACAPPSPPSLPPYFFIGCLAYAEVDGADAEEGLVDVLERRHQPLHLPHPHTPRARTHAVGTHTRTGDAAGRSPPRRPASPLGVIKARFSPLGSPWAAAPPHPAYLGHARRLPRTACHAAGLCSRDQGGPCSTAALPCAAQGQSSDSSRLGPQQDPARPAARAARSTAGRQHGTAGLYSGTPLCTTETPLRPTLRPLK